MRIDPNWPPPRDPQPDPLYHPVLLCKLCGAGVPNTLPALHGHLAHACRAASAPLRVRAAAGLAVVRA